MQSTSSILLKSNNMTKDEIDSVCKHLSQPSKSKYVVEDLNKDIQTGKILDAKEIKKMKFCVKFKGETPKRKKPLKPSSSSKSDKDDSDVKRKAEEETNQKDKDEYSNDEKDDDKNAKNKKSKKLKTAVTIDKK
ncbi:MAG: hypothetical protein KDC73_11120 [Ignavibacteriae bacterium]|nr:hypothetical protein [Ignavibacteriota bacterium]MCB9242435.1 hypothetical protein [Ignavibacteriales bacterium]